MGERDRRDRRRVRRRRHRRGVGWTASRRRCGDHPMRSRGPRSGTTTSRADGTRAANCSSSVVSCSSPAPRTPCACTVLDDGSWDCPPFEPEFNLLRIIGDTIEDVVIEPFEASQMLLSDVTVHDGILIVVGSVGDDIVRRLGARHLVVRRRAQLVSRRDPRRPTDRPDARPGCRQRRSHHRVRHRVHPAWLGIHAHLGAGIRRGLTRSG